jgi:ABC-type transport system substrate-binding protein
LKGVPYAAWHTASGGGGIGDSGVLRLGIATSDLWVDSPLDPGVSGPGELLNELYSGLVKLDDNLHVMPDLAQAMPTISADHLTYTFTLRPNLRFADGTPLTAADVVASISRALSKAEGSPTAPLYLGHIKGAAAWTAGKAHSLAGIGAPDARTVRITLDKPISYFLSALAMPPSWVVKRGLAPGVNLSAPHAQSLTVASGPFMFGKSWRYRQEIDLVPNPHWYAAASIKLKEITYRFFSDDTQQYRAYQTGQIDLTGVPSALVQSMRNNPDMHVQAQLSSFFLSPNLGADAVCRPAHCAPFDDIHFRRALLYAIDRTAITQHVWHGEEEPLCGLIPRGMLGYDPSLCSLTPYDPARAR